MNFYKKATFVKSIIDLKDLENRKNEVIFIGKSNVGKSSLINALTNNSKLAFTSKKPGHTRLLNYFLIDDSFYFVDSPGYGYSQKKDVDYTFYGDMLEKYFENNKYLKLVVLLLDSRHLPTDDDYDFYKFLISYNYPFCIALTKCDKLNQSEKSKIYKNLKDKLDVTKENSLILLTSSKDDRSLLILKETIDHYIALEDK